MAQTDPIQEEEPLLITTEEGERYLRKGYCSGCGWCCKVLTRVKISAGDIEDRYYAQARGVPTDKDSWHDLYEPCPLLTHANLCSIYTDRPKTCREFPQRPWQIEDSPCTYFFERIE